MPDITAVKSVSFYEPAEHPAPEGCRRVRINFDPESVITVTSSSVTFLVEDNPSGY